MKEALKLALRAMESKKALDVVALNISGIASFASYFLICSGENPRQIQAIADEIDSALRKQGQVPNHVEGYRNAEWVLLDYVDIVIHIFSKNARAYYDLERLWRDAKKLDPKKLLQPRARAGAARKMSRGAQAEG